MILVSSSKLILSIELILYIVVFVAIILGGYLGLRLVFRELVELPGVCPTCNHKILRSELKQTWSQLLFSGGFVCRYCGSKIKGRRR